MRSAWKREGVITRKWFISLESVVRPVSFVALVPVIALCVQCCIDRCMQSHLSIYQQFVLLLCISLICFCCRRASIVWNMPKMKRKSHVTGFFPTLQKVDEVDFWNLTLIAIVDDMLWFLDVFVWGFWKRIFWGGPLSTPSISCWTMAKPQS